MVIHRTKAKHVASICLWLSILTAPSLASAALTVIYDSGKTQSLAPFLDVFDEEDKEKGPQISPSPPETQALGAADLERLLPIHSAGLTPGRVEPRTLQQPFARPFFLIGSDLFSREWLATHRDRLVEIGAVGMLVEAETLDDLQAIAKIAQGLPILPASANDIAEALDLAHYPVLITKDGIEQ
ncbi:MAG: integrating conjugative element protein [Chromatiaceae bacterium]|nr:integrating conjugative element protein [Chromatiaceae bacterium]